MRDGRSDGVQGMRPTLASEFARAERMAQRALRAEGERDHWRSQAESFQQQLEDTRRQLQEATDTLAAIGEPAQNIPMAAALAQVKAKTALNAIRKPQPSGPSTEPAIQ